MQLELQVFLALFFAHLLGDFVFQTGRVVEGKKLYRAGAYLNHGGVHLLLAVLALALFTPLAVYRPPVLAALALLIGAHLLLDLAKSGLIRWRAGFDRLPLFLVDQLLHLLIIVAAALIAAQSVPETGWIADIWRQERDWLLAGGVILVASVFPAGYFIRYLLRPLSSELAGASQAADPGQEAAELSNAGLYLGWLERALLVIAFATGSYAAVGLIIAAKSVARFPEFKSRAFAEYFLIGTLASVAVAAAGGWLLRTALTALAS